MIEDLRWILLVAGILLIAGVYLWGLRARRRSAAPGHEHTVRTDAPGQGRAATATVTRREPELEPENGSSEPTRAAPASGAESLPVIEVDREVHAPARQPNAGRREPRIDAPAAVSSPVRTRTADATAGTPMGAVRPPVPQKIVALRITAPAATPFEGRALREAIEAARLEFGRYQVFHRLHADGEPVFSLASLKEPGTFDPATMDGVSYRGVALFAVLPGPLPPTQAFDALVEAAGALAARLGGLLQDERGAPLSMARLEQLRAELLAFERARSSAAVR
jgi:cell division protein ZipA